MFKIRPHSPHDPAKRAGRLRQRHGLIVKGKRISCPPHYDYEHGFPLIRSLRASAQQSTSVLFSFVLSLLIVAGSFAIRQSKTILARSCEAGRALFTVCRPFHGGHLDRCERSPSVSLSIVLSTGDKISA